MPLLQPLGSATRARSACSVVPNLPTLHHVLAPHPTPPAGGASGSLTLSRIGTSYKTAADRAAEAASRVPDEPPMPKRKSGEGRRKVAWAGDDDLLAVRWFRKVRRGYLGVVWGLLWRRWGVEGILT